MKEVQKIEKVSIKEEKRKIYNLRKMGDENKESRKVKK